MKKKINTPKVKEKGGRYAACSHCKSGYILISLNPLVSVECGYCLGTGGRSIP